MHGTPWGDAPEATTWGVHGSIRQRELRNPQPPGILGTSGNLVLLSMVPFAVVGYAAQHWSWDVGQPDDVAVSAEGELVSGSLRGVGAHPAAPEAATPLEARDPQEPGAFEVQTLPDHVALHAVTSKDSTDSSWAMAAPSCSSRVLAPRTRERRTSAPRERTRGRRVLRAASGGRAYSFEPSCRCQATPRQGPPGDSRLPPTAVTRPLSSPKME